MGSEAAGTVVARLRAGVGHSVDICVGAEGVRAGSEPVTTEKIRAWDRDGLLDWESDDAKATFMSLSGTGKGGADAAGSKWAGPVALAVVWVVTVSWCVAAVLWRNDQWLLWSALGMAVGIGVLVREISERSSGAGEDFALVMLIPLLMFAMPWTWITAWYSPYEAATAPPMAAGAALVLAVRYTIKLVIGRYSS